MNNQSKNYQNYSRLEVSLAELQEPRNLKAEGQVLGAMIESLSCLDAALEKLKDQDFYDPAYRKIFQTLSSIRKSGKAVDFVLLATMLPSEYSDALGRLSSATVSILVFDEVLKIVTEVGRLRRLQKVASEICYLSSTCDLSDAAEVSDKAEALILEQQLSQSSTLRTSSEVTMRVVELLEKSIERKNSGMSAIDISTGIDDLDAVTDGWKAGEMVVIAARPGCGKTALGLQCARVNLKKGKRVGFISLEMAAEELVYRNTAANANMNLRKLRCGDLTDYEANIVCQNFEEQGEWNLFFEDVNVMNSNSFRSKARRLVSVHKVDLIILDYLQLMEGDDAENRVQAITKITRSIKTIAKELKVPIVVLAQLNRKSGEFNERPQLHHLRESGSIEQDADAVVLISRTEKLDDDEGESEVKERQHNQEWVTVVDLAKQRNGPTGETTCIFEGRYQRFVKPKKVEKVSNSQAAVDRWWTK